MESIVNPFKYEVLKWAGPETECNWEAETFLPARTQTGPMSRPVHFDKNVFVDSLEEYDFVVKVQTKTTVYHNYEGVPLEPGTYRFNPDFADFECVSR